LLLPAFSAALASSWRNTALCGRSFDAVWKSVTARPNAPTAFW
jgi:hypothetical protein